MLYRTETLLQDLGATADERYQKRQSTSKAELIKFKKWLDKTVLRVPKQSALGRAVHYTLGQWPKLVRYIDDGRLRIDNNRAERAIRPFVVGRRRDCSPKVNEVHAIAVFFTAWWRRRRQTGSCGLLGALGESTRGLRIDDALEHTVLTRNDKTEG